MSYDLDFWKYKSGIYLDNQEVYMNCSNEQNVEGLENSPIKSVIQDIQKEFLD